MIGAFEVKHLSVNGNEANVELYSNPAQTVKSNDWRKKSTRKLKSESRERAIIKKKPIENFS